jgi:hypothetical protein
LTFLLNSAISNLESEVFAFVNPLGLNADSISDSLSASQTTVVETISSALNLALIDAPDGVYMMCLMSLKFKFKNEYLNKKR